MEALLGWASMLAEILYQLELLKSGEELPSLRPKQWI